MFLEDRQRSVRVAIVGVGNCASSLVQGLEFYKDGPEETGSAVPGLMRTKVGPYGVADIRICAAFDVNAAKVGKDIADAILAAPNNTFMFSAVPPTGAVVRRGPTLDGLGTFLRGDIEEASEPVCDVAAVLRESRTDVLVSYLPVGAQRATEYYADQALAAKCAFVNCIPVFIASSPIWRSRFEQARLPLLGDDIKSQVGATIVHRMLTGLLRDRGVRLDRTYQLNFGGNADFKNMLERERLASKKISKTSAVQAEMRSPLPAESIHIGPSDYVPWLTDRKIAMIRVEGTGFGGVPITMDVKLEVWDSPNSAGIVIDAVRCARLALDRGIGGALTGPSSSFMKSPPTQYGDHEALERTQAFIDGENR